MRVTLLTAFTVLIGLLTAVAVAVESRVALIAAVVQALLVPLALWSMGGASRTGGDGSAPDDYEVLGKLGEGGMGEVFRARQAGLQREVALKRIKPLRATEQDRRRFRREARVLSALSSPHTINVFDAGISDDGSFFYVMELLDGKNLEQLVAEEGAQPAARVIHILRQALRSLAEAHEQGLVHRDLKPANLMVCRYGGDLDFVKVLDFGLVKIAEGDSEFSEPLSAVGAMPGTPAFIPPEAILGSGFIDARSDLYSLGAIAFFLMTGGYLFDAESPMAMIHAQLNQPAPPLSERATHPVPPRLEELVAACLAKERDDRPASARALLHELEPLAIEEPWTVARAEACWQQPAPLSGPANGGAQDEGES